MKLFISGRQFSTTRPDPPHVKKIKEFLNSQKDGELFGSLQIAQAVGCSLDYVHGKTYGFLDDYKHVWNHKKYFGNKATIVQLKKELAKQCQTSKK